MKAAREEDFLSYGFCVYVSNPIRQEKKSEKVYTQTSADIYIYITGDIADLVYIDAINAGISVQR